MLEESANDLLRRQGRGAGMDNEIDKVEVLKGG